MQLLVNEEAAVQALVVSEDVDRQTDEDSNKDRNISDDEDGPDATHGLYNISKEFTPTHDFPAMLQSIPHVDLGTSISTLVTAEDHSAATFTLSPSHSLLTNSTPWFSAWMKLWDVPYKYPASVSAPSNLLPMQNPDLDYIYHDQLAYFFQNLDFSYIGADRAPSEPIVSPPIVSPAMGLHDELPHLPAAPGIQAATLWPQLTALQVPSPPFSNEIARGAATKTETGTSNHLAPEEPKGPCHTTHQHIPSKHEQALNSIGLFNAHICTMTEVIEDKENDGSNFTPTKCKAKPAHKQANK
ncbi:hypothetical protein BDR05DRAFT_942671 [Suillus weaverae]|nr:hypothetical protein BDR05DRAFT_942671 [Suillus weaverae]